jgi:NTE family protein
VYRALREHGIEIDWVGGTSIGAVMATYVASDQPYEAVMDNARRSFAVNPTGDFNMFPLISLIKGLRLRGVLERAVNELVGFDGDTEDLWKNYYCVATNYTQAREHLITHGNIVHALLASISIPGALPPVIHEGDLLCDGGTFNNFPVDVMHRMRGVGHVIGVDLNMRTRLRIEHAEMPSTMALLRDRFRPERQRRYRLPSLPSYLMTVTGLYSHSRQNQARQQCDLYFHPVMDRVGMLQWNRFDQIAQRGYEHAKEVIAAMEATTRPRFGMTVKDIEAADAPKP